jgi:glycerol-3-phosphate dehydrogenase subunit B
VFFGVGRRRVTRVLVVGGGIAGCAAAVAAARQGATVTVVSRAPGATALYAGAMEIATDLETLLAKDPNHPFSRLELDAVRIGGELDDACGALQSLLDRVGLPFRGSWRRSGIYADLHGFPRPAGLVPSTVAPGELSALRGRRVAVAGFDQVGDYEAAATAEALRETAGIDAFPVNLDLDGLPDGASLTDLFGRPAPRPGRQRPAAIAYPPGMDELPEGAFELLAAPPSPHGWRLQQALERVLEATGVRSVKAAVTSFKTRRGRVGAAVTAGRELAADSFVLATGRFIGGGLEKSRPPVEPLLGLGVFFQGRPVEGATAHAERHLEYLSSAPGFEVGLRTDPELRPLDAGGQVAYENLRAAGSVLGGYDYAAGFGFGVPILTGWLAGRQAAR